LEEKGREFKSHFARIVKQNKKLISAAGHCLLATLFGLDVMPKVILIL
jgi:hypothetical protein